MNRVGSKCFFSHLLVLCVALALAVLNACDSGTDANAAVALTSSSKSKSSSSKKSYPDSFKPNDKEYPYANIPRIVIYTENQQKIKDRETEIPAKLQIWGKKEAESEIMDLTIRGRGNSSWDAPKKSYKIEFVNKQSMLGMPKDKDWALISNYADKTFLRNKISYSLGTMLEMPYSPRSEFVELYLNGVYLGVYQFSETVKIGKNRINVNDKDSSFLVEFDMKSRSGETVFVSNSGRSFRIHSPKNSTEEKINVLEKHLNFIEDCLEKKCYKKSDSLEKIFSLKEYVPYYWVQEFSKNIDGAFKTSVFFTWNDNSSIHMGPLWDFDLAYGGWDENFRGSGYWYIRNYYWNKSLFQDTSFKKLVNEYWKGKRLVFETLLDTIDSYKVKLKTVAKNNYKKWPVLQSVENEFHLYTYESYEDAVQALKNWIILRIKWIDENVN